MPHDQTVLPEAPRRLQRTIARRVECRGIGFLYGADVKLAVLPAPAGHGIAFRRLDCPGTAAVPATLDHVVARARRTSIEHAGVTVELIEHVMAALAGTRIDNCLVELDSPEPPGFDGSCLNLARSLNEAGVETQDLPRQLLVIDRPMRVTDDAGGGVIVLRPLSRPILAMTYHLDYGPRAPISPQIRSIEITPATFRSELSFARTFVLEEEVSALQAQGYGRRVTPSDLLVIGPDGIVGNSLRCSDECARHKLLDCVGDFALLGADVIGHVDASRSGHRLNHLAASRLAESASVAAYRTRAA